MKSRSLLALSLGFAATVSFSSSAAVIDLSGWSSEGEGTWTTQGDNSTVLQSANSDPTVFFNGMDSQGMQLSGSISVEQDADDDFIGFVLGYNAGDLTSDEASYLLIDWKQADQSFYNRPELSFEGDANAGLSVSQVNGALSIENAWRHDGAVTELQRGTNLGSTGWEDNTAYSFDLIFNADQVQVYVNDVLELDISGTFTNGSFGFYNFSQPNVLYAGITEDVVEPPANVSAPLTAGLMGLGLAGIFLRRRQ